MVYSIWNQLDKEYIVKLDNLNNFIQIFPSANAAAKAINGDAKRILNICKNKKGFKTCKGFKFQFKENYDKEVNINELTNDCYH